MQFIVRLSPEITIKSSPVRRRLVRVLRLNIVNAAAAEGLTLKADAQWDKVLVSAELAGNASCSAEAELLRRICDLLGRIPGIHSFAQITALDFTGFEDLYLQARLSYAPLVCGHSFAVRVRRRGTHPFTSRQAEAALGALFLRDCPGAHVDLSTPEVTVRLGIEGAQAYVAEAIHHGLDGFPVATQGQAAALVSGGFDSAVAAYRMVRRGLKVHYVFFSLGGSAQEWGVMQSCLRLWEHCAASHRVRFVSVPFEQVIAQLLEKVHHGVRGVILKRLMVRAAGQLAQRWGAEAVITGESLGQVSSQTLVNLGHIDQACPVLVLRPLLACDKQEIIDQAEQLGTAVFARAMPEYCGIISDHPNVCPRRELIAAQEALLDSGLLEQALTRARFFNIRELRAYVQSLQSEVEIVSEPGPGEVVVDIRAPEEVRRAPLAMTSASCLTLPFYRVLAEFGGLDRLRTYLLYCDQGVMSLLQARHLLEQGYHNVKVLRPEGAACSCRTRAKSGS